MKFLAIIAVVYTLGLLGWMIGAIVGVFAAGYALGRLSDSSMGRMLRWVTLGCVLAGVVIYFKPDWVEVVFKLWR